jgi:hypothetical protein
VTETAAYALTWAAMALAFIVGGETFAIAVQVATMSVGLALCIRLLAETAVRTQQSRRAGERRRGGSAGRRT